MKIHFESNIFFQFQNLNKKDNNNYKKRRIYKDL